MTITFASLFCGCGGFDLGFIKRGFRCIGAFDNDPDAITVHTKNLCCPAFIYDLSRGLHRVSSDFRPHILLSGSPCQGFSTAGKRKFDDPRNELLLIAGRIALTVKPNVFIAENVAAVASGEHSFYWHALNSMLRDAGYWTADLLCEADRMGVAQTRRRRVLVAWNQRKPLRLGFAQQQSHYLRDVLCDLDGLPNHTPALLPTNSDAYMIARRICPGQKLSNVRAGTTSVHTWHIPEVYGETSYEERRLLETLLRLRRRNRVRTYGDADPVSQETLQSEFQYPLDAILTELIAKHYIRRIGDNFDLVHTFNGKFRRLRWDEPSFTVDTRFSSPRYFLHPDEHRGFTIREAARIQGFPDNFTFYGEEKVQMRHVGNAVPPPVAYMLAEFIQESLFA